MDNYKRRDFIRLSALSFAAVALQLNSITSYAQKANGYLGKWNPNTKLNWDAFLERLTLLSKSQHQLSWNEKKYTQQVKNLLLQCNFREFENVKKEMDGYVDKHPNKFESSRLHEEIDFEVSLFQFEKGEYISHHDHPEMTGVINVVSGNALLKNYTVEEQLSAPKKFLENGMETYTDRCLIREIDNEIAKAGDVSILTSHEGNIHCLMPNEFTQLVDVFTPAYKADTRTKWYKVNEDGYYQNRKGIYEAEYIVTELSKVKTISIDPSILNRYVGSYALADNSMLVISKTGDSLFFQRGKNNDNLGKKFELLPYAENKFWLDNKFVRCEFSVNLEGQAQTITKYYMETTEIAKRIK
jgi:hypothetical protein